eukprot:6145510-Amphidinium_carterae.2
MSLKRASPPTPPPCLHEFLCTQITSGKRCKASRVQGAKFSTSSLCTDQCPRQLVQLLIFFVLTQDQAVELDSESINRGWKTFMSLTFG